MTYGALATAIGVHHRALGWTLYPILHHCDAEGWPLLTSLVVRGGSGRPGGGLIAALGSRDLDDELLRVFAFDWTSEPNPFTHALVSVETQERLAVSLINAPERAEEIYAQVRVRGIAQRIFRAALQRAYGGACAFCGLSFPEALEGAHIVPWRTCAPRERLDPRNGLLLCATHHRLFDADWLTLTTDFIIEHQDADESGGDYSPADDHITRRLRGRRAAVPERRDLRPSAAYIARRNKARAG
jgi:putative restriction endonuclease